VPISGDLASGGLIPALSLLERLRIASTGSGLLGIWIQPVAHASNGIERS
jgi:hypothetical protein